MATDYVFRHYPRISSTQDEVRDLLAGSDPVVVCADRQTEGRGRQGSEWENAPRSVAVSVGWLTSWPIEARPRLSLVAGLAARQVAEEFGSPILLKWPNDLMVGPEGSPGKVGGVLAETSDDKVVVGFGLNVWWPEPPAGYAAVSAVDPGAQVVPDLSRRFAENLLARVSEGPARWGRGEYRRACMTIGQQVTWSPDGRGEVLDIDDEGRLVVLATDGTRQVLSSGEVHHLRPII